MRKILFVAIMCAVSVNGYTKDVLGNWNVLGTSSGFTFSVRDLIKFNDGTVLATAPTSGGTIGGIVFDHIYALENWQEFTTMPRIVILESWQSVTGLAHTVSIGSLSDRTTVVEGWISGTGLAHTVSIGSISGRVDTVETSLTGSDGVVVTNTGITQVMELPTAAGDPDARLVWFDAFSRVSNFSERGVDGSLFFYHDAAAEMRATATPTVGDVLVYTGGLWVPQVDPLASNVSVLESWQSVTGLAHTVSIGSISGRVDVVEGWVSGTGAAHTVSISSVSARVGTLESATGDYLLIDGTRAMTGQLQLHNTGILFADSTTMTTAPTVTNTGQLRTEVDVLNLTASNFSYTWAPTVSPQTESISHGLNSDDLLIQVYWDTGSGWEQFTTSITMTTTGNVNVTTISFTSGTVLKAVMRK
jgi:hypothetical protein